jgi:hypothetical protein
VIVLQDGRVAQDLRNVSQGAALRHDAVPSA